MKKNRSIEEVYNLIEDFMKNNDIDPFHLEMLLNNLQPLLSFTKYDFVNGGFSQKSPEIDYYKRACEHDWNNDRFEEIIEFNNCSYCHTSDTLSIIYPTEEWSLICPISIIAYSSTYDIENLDIKIEDVQLFHIDRKSFKKERINLTYSEEKVLADKMLKCIVVINKNR